MAGNHVLLMIAVLVLVPSFSSGGLFPKWLIGRNVEASYDKINDLLEKRLPSSSSVSENLAEARKLLAEEEASGQLALKVPIRGALRRFIELEESIKEAKVCTNESVAILKASDEATRGQSRREPTRRVDQIVNYFMTEHAKACTPLYEKTYRELSPELDGLTKQFIHEFLKPVRRHDQDWTLLSREPHMDKASILDYDLYTKEAIQTIKEIGAHDPELSSLRPSFDERRKVLFLEKDKIKSIYERYIVRPCENLLAAFGALFTGFDFDMNVLSRSDVSPEILIGFSDNKICSSLIKKKSGFLKKILRELKPNYE